MVARRAFLLGKMRQHLNSEAAIKAIGDLSTLLATHDLGRHPSRAHEHDLEGNRRLNDKVSLSYVRDEL
jgi:hypothetical protein